MRSRLLALLHLLLLLGMFLRQLLPLLLVLLLQLLFSLVVGFLLFQPLVVLVLLLLELLAFLVLLCLELLLLLLIFLVLFHVTRVWSGKALDRLKVSRVDSGCRTSSVVLCTGRRIMSKIFSSTRGRAVNHPRLSCRYNGGVAKLSGFGSSSVGRHAVVCGGPQLGVSVGSLHMLILCGYRREMSLTCGSFFLARGTFVYSTVAPVEAGAINSSVDHRSVVDIVNLRDIHIIHCAVVEKVSVVPTSAFIPVTKVSESVADAAVESYFRPPIALMEEIAVFFKCPIPWGPEKTNLRGYYPGARYPIVIVI